MALTINHSTNEITVSDLLITSAGGMRLPVGTTAQRPAGQVGFVRYNSTSTRFEGYSGSTWSDIGSISFFNHGDSGTTTKSLNYYLGIHQRIRATGAFTITLDNFPSEFTPVILLEAVAFGSYAITWPSINWVKPDGTTTTNVNTWLSSTSGRSTFQATGVDFIKIWLSSGVFYGSFAA